MTIDDVIARFEAPRKSPNGFIVRCPAHADDTASLHVSTGRDGRVLLYCHAGCATADVLEQAGLTAADLFQSPPSGTPVNGTSRPTIVARYDYRDEDNRVLYQVVRYQPKTFRQRRPDGHGGWTWKLEGMRRVPYRLPDLIDRTDLVIAEGEKDVDRLWTLGIAATTNASGAGKWTDALTTALVKAGVRFVTVIPDNDEPGRAHAEAVAQSCHAAGIAVKIVTLPGLPEKGDVTDWLDAGHTADELKAMIAATPTWTPATDAASSDKINSTPVAAVVRLSDVQPESVSWLWPRRLARGKLTLLVGDGGLGKSTVSLAMAATLSRGARWPDGGQAPRGATVILSAEDGLADTIRPRLDALGADCTEIHAVQAIRTRDRERPISLAVDLPALEKIIRQTSAVLVIVDPIGAYLGGADSYKDAEVRSILGPLAAMAERTGACVLGIMHIGKGAERGAQHRVLGSVGFVNAARIVLAVGRHPDEDEDSHGRRLLVPIKQNLCEPADTLAFTLRDGELLWSDEPVSGVTADQVLTHRPARDDHASDAAAIIADLLDTEDWPLPARIAEEAAKAHGVSIRSMRRAANRRGITTRRIADRWLWYRREDRDKGIATDGVRLSPSVPLQNSLGNSQGDKGTTGHDERRYA